MSCLVQVWLNSITYINVALIVNTLTLKEQFKSVPESKDHLRKNAKFAVKHNIYYFIWRYRLHVLD